MSRGVMYVILEIFFVVFDKKEEQHYLFNRRKRLMRLVHHRATMSEIYPKILHDFILEIQEEMNTTHEDYLEYTTFAGWTVYPPPPDAREPATHYLERKVKAFYGKK
jgi:hypothetical protein